MESRSMKRRKAIQRGEPMPEFVWSCPACGSEVAVLLGSLGSKTWVRCRDCGMDHARDLPEQDRTMGQDLNP